MQSSKIQTSNPGDASVQDDQKDVKPHEASQGILAQRGYRQVSLPIPLIERIEKYLDEHKGEGYTSIPEFIRQAIREKIE